MQRKHFHLCIRQWNVTSHPAAQFRTSCGTLLALLPIFRRTMKQVLACCRHHQPRYVRRRVPEPHAQRQPRRRPHCAVLRNGLGMQIWGKQRRPDSAAAGGRWCIDPHVISCDIWVQEGNCQSNLRSANLIRRCLSCNILRVLVLVHRWVAQEVCV